MLYLSITLFAIAAILGVTMLMKWIAGQGAPAGIIYTHGAVAASALTLAVIYYVKHPEGFPVAALVLFGLGAIGGLYLFFTERRGKRPVGIAVVHGLIGVTAFLLLAFIL